MIYRIDEDGCLLDSDNTYIMDNNNQHIKLSKEQIQKLKEFKILG